ncbi:hypothetical protein [Flavobacterium sp.]|uniref:phosphoribosyltransferase-like protein n=1 Tax=Flavobacterium sp. TaxID=239 RepID=UPI0039E26A74
MRPALAEKLLAKIMMWNSTELSKERPLLQALSNLKYNEYQQFSIGTRFIESLVKWLSQFATLDERNVAYDFFKRRLIFISNDQMLHLVNITFSDRINPFLIKKTASETQTNPYLINKITKSVSYTKVLRRSLFIGLSDGSRIDQLRRYSNLDNEQVIPTYQINSDKVNDMIANLKKSGVSDKYNTIFLIDDFTASGTSYFRMEGDERKGKIYKTIKDIFDNEAPLNSLVEMGETIDVNIIFYIATHESVDKLRTAITEWKIQSNHKFNFNIEVVQTIEDNVKIGEVEDKDFIELSKKYIEKEIVDEHWEKAKHGNYFLGYNECALPLVLVHNCPNNSMPLLWYISPKNSFTGLFPRITRHK